MKSCYLNGEILLYKDCSLHISDLLIQRGYGLFDFFRCREGRIYWLDDYTDRLFNSLSLSGIELSMSKKEFTSIINDLQQKNGDDNGAFKVIVTGGYSDNLESVSGSANLIILNVPWKRPASETFKNGVHLISCEYTRPDPEIKTLNYFNLLKLHRKMREFDAADVLYHSAWITEASRANVFFVEGDSIFTPASNILKGITRKQVLGMTGDIRIEDIGIEHLYDFDEMFITSTSRDLTPVVSVEGRKIGNGKPGKVTKEIMASFRAKGW
jgi:branched-subunit amino acid aminotransferase/4-amino-4-deoxychorismate lyase